MMRGQHGQPGTRASGRQPTQVPAPPAVGDPDVRLARRPSQLAAVEAQQAALAAERARLETAVPAVREAEEVARAAAESARPRP